MNINELISKRLEDCMALEKCVRQIYFSFAQNGDALALKLVNDALAELAALTALEEPMPCGHKARYAVNGDEGTSYCALCELKAAYD